MPQSYARVLLHIVYGTKRRVPFLEDSDLRKELYSYMAKILDEIDCPALAINGVEDHVHILCSLSRSLAIKDLLQEVKASPSRQRIAVAPSAPVYREPRGTPSPRQLSR